MSRQVFICTQCGFEIEFDRRGEDIVYDFDHTQWRDICMSREALSPASCRFILLQIRKATLPQG